MPILRTSITSLPNPIFFQRLVAEEAASLTAHPKLMLGLSEVKREARLLKGVLIPRERAGLAWGLWVSVVLERIATLSRIH